MEKKNSIRACSPSCLKIIFALLTKIVTFSIEVLKIQFGEPNFEKLFPRLLLN